MKKVLAPILVLAILLSLSVPAFAAETTQSNVGPGEYSMDVTAKYVTSTSTDTVYNVDIAWDSLTFTYTEKAEKSWNSKTNTYDTKTTGSWDRTEAQITVTNRSDKSVKVTMTLTPVPGTGITTSLAGGSGTLAAYPGGSAKAASISGRLTISGTPNTTVTEAGVRIGTITVTIQ